MECINSPTFCSCTIFSNASSSSFVHASLRSSGFRTSCHLETHLRKAFAILASDQTINSPFLGGKTIEIGHILALVINLFFLSRSKHVGRHNVQNMSQIDILKLGDDSLKSNEPMRLDIISLPNQQTSQEVS